MNDFRDRLSGFDDRLLDQTLFSIAGTTVTVVTLVTVGLIVLATFIVSRLLQRALGKALAIRGIEREGTVAAAKRLLHYVILAIGLAVAFDTLGLDLSALFAAGAVFAIGIGFAMQNIAQNFVSGLILLLERSIKPGDVLEVEGRFVKVEHLGVRATTARTLDDEEIIVPNSAMVQGTVKNFTLKDSTYRLRATVGVIYGSDMALVRRTLERVAAAMEWRSRKRDPVVLLADFADSAVVYEVSVWMEDPWGMRRSKSQLHEAIWWAFKEEGIVIAFPQVDVHFDAEVGDSLRALRAVS